MPVWGIEPLLQGAAHQKNTMSERGGGGKLPRAQLGVSHFPKFLEVSIKQAYSPFKPFLGHIAPTPAGACRSGLVGPFKGLLGLLAVPRVARHAFGTPV